MYYNMTKLLTIENFSNLYQIPLSLITSFNLFPDLLSFHIAIVTDKSRRE